MRFTLLTPLLLACMAIGSPVSSDASKETRSIAPTVVPGGPLVSHPNVKVANTKLPPGATTTSPNTGFLPLSIALADSVVLCAPHDCTSCFSFPLSTLSTGVCYTPSSAFYSGFLYTASGASPGYNLYASTSFTKCGNAQLFGLNVCTNTSPTTLSGFDFFLV